jgi:hypothetical protein
MPGLSPAAEEFCNPEGNFLEILSEGISATPRGDFGVFRKKFPAGSEANFAKSGRSGIFGTKSEIFPKLSELVFLTEASEFGVSGSWVSEKKSRDPGGVFFHGRLLE